MLRTHEEKGGGLPDLDVLLVKRTRFLHIRLPINPFIFIKPKE